MAKRSHQDAFVAAAQEDTQLCVQCKSVKQLCHYPKNRNATNGHEKTCRCCTRNRRNLYNGTLHGYLTNLLNVSRSSTKHRRRMGRDHDHDIDSGFLKSLWRAQDGRCALSGMPMAHSPMTMWQASLDRVDDDRGYVPNNVRLVCLEFNGHRAIKETETLWRVAAGQLNVPVPNVSDELGQAHSRPKVGSKGGTIHARVRADGVAEHICTKCSRFLTVDRFWKSINKGCKTCRKHSCAEYRNTLRGRVRSLVSHAYNHADTRRKRGHRDRAGECSLTHDDLADMYRVQDGRCYYSDVPLQFDTGSLWLMSLERVNTTLGYHRDNCVLICVCFNATDCTSKRPGFDNAILGWSKDKFERMREVVLARFSF